mmetsp:Transcript_29709/g.54493  ORF Transcript_29709/g.54493 Transcript_29709/m.54493 type:complete len:227 (+) Transcript_29709:1197-1877(+)
MPLKVNILDNKTIIQCLCHWGYHDAPRTRHTQSATMRPIQVSRLAAGQTSHAVLARHRHETAVLARVVDGFHLGQKLFDLDPNSIVVVFGCLPDVHLGMCLLLPITFSGSRGNGKSTTVQRRLRTLLPPGNQWTLPRRTLRGRLGIHVVLRIQRALVRKIIVHRAAHSGDCLLRLGANGVRARQHHVARSRRRRSERRSRRPHGMGARKRRYRRQYGRHGADGVRS